MFREYLKVIGGYLPLMVFFIGSSLLAQRSVFNGQDLLKPHLTDPSFVGETGNYDLNALIQVSDSKRKQNSQYISVQLPIYDNVAFGVDYFKDYFDIYSYSMAMVTTAIRVGLGDNQFYAKFGLSGGIDTRYQSRPQLNPIPGQDDFAPVFDGKNTDFVYRAGLHFKLKKLTVGGFYNALPVQNVMVGDTDLQLFGYNTTAGYTGYLQYEFIPASGLRLSPIVRYLDYGDISIFEGALKADYKTFFTASVSYKNDYSINPAIQFNLFRKWGIGYSYEKAIGAMNFQDIHGLSLSYNFKNANGREEPEWLENAKETIAKIDAAKRTKKKKKDQSIKEPLPENEVPNEKSVDSVKVAEVEQPAVEVKEEKNIAKSDYVYVAMNSRYYLVADSFTNIETAIALKKKLKEEGQNSLIGKAEDNPGFYVILDSDLDETIAQEKLDKLKTTGNFPNARVVNIK